MRAGLSLIVWTSTGTEKRSENPPAGRVDVKSEFPCSGAASVVIFGYGNPARGDDALGLLLLEHAAGFLQNRETGIVPAQISLIEDYQLQIEHAEDLRERTLALFLDADVSCEPPCRFRRVRASEDASYTTHELSPEAVLHVYRQITAEDPPASFMLSVRGENFGLGEGLSSEAESNMFAAKVLLEKLLGDLTERAWMEQLSVIR